MRQIGPGATSAVSLHNRDEHVREQGVVTGLRAEHGLASACGNRVSRIAPLAGSAMASGMLRNIHRWSRRTSKRTMSTDPAISSAASNPGRTEHRGRWAAPVHRCSHPGAAVAEHEPAHDGEPERGHLFEVALNGGAAGGYSQVRAPDVRAEVHPVVHGGPVCGPGIVATVQK